MSKKQQKQAAKRWRYTEFLREIGIGMPELRQLFAEEVRNLSFAELLMLKESDFFPPATWTKEQKRLFIKMLARAAVKAKRRDAADSRLGLHRMGLSRCDTRTPLRSFSLASTSKTCPTSGIIRVRYRSL